MTKEQQTAYVKAMEQARKLAKLKNRRAMAPHVSEWAKQMKIVLGANNGR